MEIACKGPESPFKDQEEGPSGQDGSENRLGVGGGGASQEEGTLLVSSGRARDGAEWFYKGFILKIELLSLVGDQLWSIKGKTVSGTIRLCLEQS